ncbi:MAG: DoxX family protein [Candidatus Marinimicrobia bacterium]|nr:DoxX family protein [Candidatus Neomarinimicrobiota bacterium]
MKIKLLKILKFATIYLMAFFYIKIGVDHFINPGYYMNIMPPYLPLHLELVYISGVLEATLGSMLLFKKTRFYAGWGLILLLIAVYPANIYLAFNQLPQEAIGISHFLASWIRLPIQFVFIALAYWHTKK